MHRRLHYYGLRRKTPSLLGTVALLTGAVLAPGQSSVPSANAVHAVVGARIEIGDGKVIEKGNLIIRNGLIVAVGPDAAVPPGADVLDGKGLTLYPGFIEGFTTKGTKLPDAETTPDSPAPLGEYASAMMREANRKGIHPEWEARRFLNLPNDVMKPYRTVGFTTLLVAPGGGNLGGIATLVNLSGRPNRDAVLAPKVALAISFDNDAGGNGYPDSLLGRIAQVRQTLADGRWQESVQRAYGAGGDRRPASDLALESLVPALHGQMPSMIEASTAAQIDRGLRLADEFGLHPILVGGQEAFRRLDAIKAANTPLVLALNFGVEPVAKTKPNPDPANALETEFLAEPADRLAERHRVYDESVRNVDQVRSKGIPFALTTLGNAGPKEFMDALRAAVKRGFPKAAALRALTVDAARILGVDRRVGTLEVGKVANVSAMTGDFLDEKTTVKIQYIDGYRVDPNRDPAGPPPVGRPGGHE